MGLADGLLEGLERLKLADNECALKLSDSVESTNESSGTSTIAHVAPPPRATTQGTSSVASTRVTPSLLNIHAKPFVPDSLAVSGTVSSGLFVKPSRAAASTSYQHQNSNASKLRQKRKDKAIAEVKALPASATNSAKFSNLSADIRNDSPTQLKLPLRSLENAAPQPRLFWLPRPKPTEAYLAQATKAKATLESKQSLLIILDLNGTLLFRKKRGGSKFIARPRVKAFIEYLLANHHIMVWSSARPTNVENMCKQLFSPAQREQIVAIWARDRLRLSTEAYQNKVQVYKQLSWVWQDPEIRKVQESLAVATPWSQENTVLIDDSIEKAASEPHNVIQIEEFEARADQMQADVLGQVMKYLEELRTQHNVSAYMREHPFTCKSMATNE